MNSSSLQDRRVWIGGGCVAAVLILAAAWFLLINPELSSAKQARSQAKTTQGQNDSLAANNAKLAEQYRGISTLRGSLARAIAALPPTSGLPAFTQEVTRAATAQRVKLTTITVGAATPAVSTAATPATTAPAASGNSGAGAATTTAPTTTAGTPAAAGGGQFSFQITLTTQAPTSRQLAFVKALENGPRSALLTSTQISSTGSGKQTAATATTMTTQLTIFSAPMSAPQLKQIDTLLGLHR